MTEYINVLTGSLLFAGLLLGGAVLLFFGLCQLVTVGLERLFDL